MSFERPLLLLSLLVVALAVGVWIAAERRRARYAVRFTNLEVLATVVGGRQWTRYVPPVLFALALAVLFVSLARPQVNRMVASERATVILVLDTSRSMQAQDVEPTRLAAAQEAMRTFLDEVPGRLRVGLVVFAGEAQVATPPTADHELVEQSVDSVGEFLIFGGTAIGDALQTAVELGKQSVDQPPKSDGQTAAPDTGAGAPNLGTRTLASLAQSEPSPVPGCGEKSLVSILFLSDGAQTRGILEPLAGAELARDACFPVYTVALGTPEGTIRRGFGGFNQGGANELIPVPPDPETLRAIAEMTGGAFSEARDAETLESAYADLGSNLGREPGQTEITFILVAIAAVLLVAAGVLSACWSPRIP
ncbi:MAG: VWA domain-containing protein [Actinobacteria bacterium]|nr:VWA domain-containing protein [Actinomycetota bacterium]